MRRDRKYRWPFAVYDLETVGLGGPLIQAGFFDGSEYFNFNSMDAFLERVLSRKYREWRIFAHFGGKYDVAYVYDELRRSKWRERFEMSFYCAGSCVIAFTAHGQGEKDRWRFTDSYRLLSAPLDRLCKEFSVEHQKLAYDPNSVDYNRNDCIGLYEVLDRFFSEHDMCSETLPSHAMKIWRRDYLERDLWQPDRKVEDFVRLAYTAGRCEIYRWDERDLYKYDVNSLFPAAMTGLVPVEFLCRSKRLPDDDSLIGFYEAEVDYPEDVYLPALPWHVGRDRRLYFPVGRFRGHWSSLELRRAIEDGASVRILDGYLFLTDTVLEPYIRSMYAKKREAEIEGNAARRFVSKILQNSLYGKFGQSREQVSYLSDPGTTHLFPVGEDEEPGPDNPRIWPTGSEGLAFYNRESNSGHILPHISATITARARMMQLDWLRMAGRVWYTDTDSVFTDVELPVSPELGQLKLEGTGRFIPYGLKEYKFEDHYAIKGLPLWDRDETGKKVELVTRAETYLRGGKVSLVRMAGMLESIRRGLPAARPVTVTRERRMPREKRARCLGGDTRPWTAAELEMAPAPRRTVSARPKTLSGIVASHGGIRRKGCLRDEWYRDKWRSRLRDEWAQLSPYVRAKVLKNGPGALPWEEMIELLRGEGYDFADESELACALRDEPGRPAPSLSQDDGWDWEEYERQLTASSAPEAEPDPPR